MTEVFESQVGPRWRWLRISIRDAVVSAVSAVVAVVIATQMITPGSGTSRPAGNLIVSATRSTSVSAPTAAQLAQWHQMVSTPAGRQRVLGDLQSAFARVGKVGMGTMPSSSAASRGAVAVAAVATSGYTAKNVLAAGASSDHFWIIASYADMIDGAIGSGIAACAVKLPGWVCSAAGSVLIAWSRGWGWATNHGVWIAIYWYPYLHDTGGRW